MPLLVTCCPDVRTASDILHIMICQFRSIIMMSTAAADCQQVLRVKRMQDAKRRKCNKAS
jgi:hypothetical protein